MNCLPLRFGISFLIALTGIASAFAQVKYPKPPDQYAVEFRYRIKADRNERIRQFEAMTKFLGDLGFKETPTEDSDLAVLDQNAERMIGTIPSSSAGKILNDPHIQTVLLMPEGFKPPDDKERVKLQIDLSAGGALERQQLFVLQTRRALEGLGFQDSIAYENRAYTRLRGTMPWGKVRNLLKDLRTQPSGWFLPFTHEEDLPEPFKSALPIRLVEVLPEEGAPAPVPPQPALPPIPPDQPYLGKLSSELQRYLLQEGKKDEKLRVEAILVNAPADDDTSWRSQLHLASPGSIEGRLGNVVTITLHTGADAARLARSPLVMSIRLPQSANVLTPAAPKDEPKKDEPKKDEPKKDELKGNISGSHLILAQAKAPFDILKETGLDRLHARGMRGTGFRIAVIDTDFTGYEKFLGKGLPPTTRFIDLTAERNSDILPEPTGAAPNTIGHGTHCALAASFGAPGADLALVRIGGDAPYQVLAAYRFMLGNSREPESFRTRREELEIDSGILRQERQRANEEYRKAFDDFEDSDAARQRRKDAQNAIKLIEVKERAMTARANRLINLESALANLKGTKVILNTVGWNTGQPLDGRSPMSRFLDEKMILPRTNPVRNSAKLPTTTLWFQPAGDTHGQCWIGNFRDADNNGVMEFAPLEAPRRPGRWTPEMNFLAWRPDGKEDAPDLPSNAQVRITVQWTEAHDPEVSEADYREPIAPLRLMLLRQRDPNGEKLATDEIEVIARTEGIAERLLAERNFGVYESALNFTLPADGRYALRVEGKMPSGVRPGGSLGIRDQEVRWELRPRLFIEVLDSPTKSKGRIVFGDYQSPLGGVAVPGDARSVVSVGALRSNNRPNPASAVGAGPLLEMQIKPDVMVYEQLPKLGDGTGPAKGSALSASLAAGMGTSLLSGGARASFFLEYLHIPPGSLFTVPERWTKR